MCKVVLLISGYNKQLTLFIKVYKFRKNKVMCIVGDDDELFSSFPFWFPVSAYDELYW